MGNNKKAKQRLIERYGEVDFLDALHIHIPNIEHHYTSKGQLQHMKQLTYHHIVEKSKGGKATIANGALLTEEHHVWFHQQSGKVQRQLNQGFQKYKKCIDEGSSVPVIFVDENDFNSSLTINIAEIRLDSKGRVRTYSRSYNKRETKDMIDRYLEEEEDYEK